MVRAGAAVWAATLVLWAFFLFVIASKLGQKDATVAEKKAAHAEQLLHAAVDPVGRQELHDGSDRAARDEH